MIIKNNIEWDFDTINDSLKECEIVAKDELHLSTYKNQVEIITSEQMLDAYTSVGMPVYYRHWSFGKSFSREQESYQRGRSGLAYELVINSDPCISYLMEDNSPMTQLLVIAHAAFGHNHFFKNNYLFKQWTDPQGIIDYLVFAKKYITKCEEKYGVAAVESLLDAAHAIMRNGINRYKKPKKLSLAEEEKRQEERQEYLTRTLNDLWRTTVPASKNTKRPEATLEIPEENILYFLEKKSPILEIWQREVIRIVRIISQYFYPQMLTKTMNEGFACSVHYHIINSLREKNLIDDGVMLEFFQMHGGVLYQHDYKSKYFSGMNPYYLGYELFKDIKRICVNPTKEDQEWFPDIANKDWREVWLDAVENYCDESFIRQYLSPHLIRKMKLFSINSNTEEDGYYTVTNIQDEDGYRNIRKLLSEEYLYERHSPKIEIVSADLKYTRRLVLQYHKVLGRELSKDSLLVLNHVRKLWGHPVILYDQHNRIFYNSD